jgi:dTDP-4-amino-4,6-dideoxygalactose transaminase
MIPRRNVKPYKGLTYYIFIWFTNLAKREVHSIKFKNSLEKLFGKNIFLLARGRFAFQLIFNSTEFKKNDEIIVPNYYLKELIPIIRNKGLKVIFCDINLKNYSYNEKELLSKINERTKYVIISHIFGICGNVPDIIKKIKKRNKNIIIIEDCAHSFGSECNGKNLGTFGDFALFSFDYIKPLNLFGGGALLVNAEKYLKKTNFNYSVFNKPNKLNTLRKIGYYCFQMCVLHSPLFFLLKKAIRKESTKSKIKKFHKTNSNELEKLSEFQSLIGYYQLINLKEKNSKLEKIRNKYENKIEDIPHIKVIENGLCSKQSNYSFFVIAKKNSLKIEKSMYKLGIDVGIKDEVMDVCSDNKELYPNSIMLYNRIVQLPFYFSLKDKQISKILTALDKMEIK